MNILRLIRFPVACLATSGVMAGFYIVLFAGLGVERVGFLPRVIVIGVCLAFASSAWNEMFSVVDNSLDASINSVIPSKISMSMGYVIASLLIVIALMLSMTVSLVTFFVVAAIIINSFLFNSIFKKIIVLDAVFYALQYSLIVVLGMSAHEYLVYLLIDPSIYIPLIFIFFYISVLRVILNVSLVAPDNDKVEQKNDFEGESLELSTEIDSVYAGRIDSERASDFEIAKKVSDNMIRRNLSVILPEPIGVDNHIAPERTEIINGVWSTYMAVVILMIIPVVFLSLYSFEPVLLGLLAINTILLAFQLFGVIDKKSFVAVLNLYNYGVISICIFCAIIIAAISENIFSKQSLAVVGILVGMTIPMLVMKKYFEKIA